MRDINIQVHNNHTVDFENDYAGLNLENLQGNITFSFDNFVEGQARAEIVINNQDGYIILDQANQTYTLPIKSSLLTGDSVLMQLVIDQEPIYNLTSDTNIDNKKTYYEKVGDNYVVVEHPVKADLGNYYEAEIPVWKSEVFYLKVGTSINATTTIPEEYPSWIEVINGLINETNQAIQQAQNVNITSEQLTDGVKVTTTNKNGEQTITIVPQGPQGEPGVPGAVKFVIVNELPTEDIQTDAIYLVPSDDPTTQDLYLEYMYINNQWELLGQKQIVVDLTDYVKFTDYASSSKAGVFLTSSTYGTSTSNGILVASNKNYSTYSSAVNNLFISKGTLENVITGKGLVSNTNYADQTVGGVIKGNVNGFQVNTSNGAVSASTFTYQQYQDVLSNGHFIGKGTLENVLTATIGDISSVIDAINGESI